ncbi:DUF3240 family protein [Rhodoblastus sp.]|jgi:hypothetical protein|uniref:DUF3240 family protein n=1 Tax=Rhodoblastus sp. TaxID=1962975 RepID=UPI0025ED3964|nr:DUF3240 family protein [Rhodoblastus sp.]
MDSELCKLTLVYPEAADDLILDFLLASHPPLSGFTSLRAEGHGAGFEGATTREMVRGRVERRLLFVVLSRARLQNLLAELHERISVPNLAYWVEPVESFGLFK